jgi:hypothetical protein
MKTKAVIVFLTLIVIYVLGFIAIDIFGDYGWTVFVFNPVLIGFLPSYFAKNKINSSKRECYSLSFITLILASFIMILFAIEGMICIVMSLPIALLFTWFGAFLGYSLNNKNGKISNSNITLILLFSSLGFLSFDYINEPEDLIPVQTKIIVNSPIENVWKNVVTFDTIPQPKEWIFKTGISYPENATIKGKGVGAIRYCNFTTGSFVEPITTWNEPNLLQFSVQSQPIPMNEWNPFWNVHPPHLEGYFQSYKGQFKLTKISNSKTLLEGTTWYKVDIYPEFYWKIWSDMIIHKIHNRVLEHIKKESEK